MTKATDSNRIHFTNDMANTLTAPQFRALETLLAVVCKDGLVGHTTPIVYTIAVTHTDYGGAWVSIKPDLPNLPESNALRSCYRMDTWHVHIGKRGKLEAWSYPRPFDQFKGRTWLGIHIAP